MVREKKSDLARDYGLDIDMENSAMAASTMTSKTYQKQCIHLYNEFMKNMKCHIRTQKEARNVLAELNKQKITNTKFSLYRSDGADLFSSAKERRRSLMDNQATLSQLFLDDSRLNTPWGLDPIIDEDLIRPQTAPSKSQHNDARTLVAKTTGVRPKTVSNIKTPTVDFSDNENSFNNESYVSYKENTSAEHVRFQSPTFHVENDTTTVVTKAEAEDFDSDEEGIDGVVDPKLERTRARRITIKADTFSKLSTGNVTAKLKDKDGDFLIKPIDEQFTSNAVDSLFVVKDPSKEKMALVRKQTNCKSSTVAADLKVNNRMAIMNSLMGIKTKKTTVAEIFNHARDRKTRHFRILLKNPPINQVVKDKWSKAATAASFARKISLAVGGKTAPTQDMMLKKVTTSLFSKSADSPANISISETCMIDDSKPGKPEKLQTIVKLFEKRSIPTPSQNENQDFSLLCTSSVANRKGLEIGDRSRQNENQDVPFVRADSIDNSPLNHSSSRLMISRQQLEIPQLNSRSQTPVNRSYSALSMRGDNNNMQLQGSDKDMTEMIRQLVEGKGDGTDGRPVSSLSMVELRKQSKFPKRGLAPKRMHNPTSSRSDTRSETSLGFSAKQIVNERVTKSLIKEQMQKDKEYQESMEKMRRRMAVGGTSKGRKFSIRR